MLVFPAEAPDTILALVLRHGHLHGLATDLSARGTALLFADIQQGLVGDRFHVPIAKYAGYESGRAHRLRVWYVLLDLRTDRAIVYQGAILNDLRAVVDGNFRILE